MEINSIKQIKFLLSRLRCNDVECCDCAKAIDCHSLYKKYLASETNEVIELSPEDETALDNLGDSVFKTGEEWGSFYKDTKGKLKFIEVFLEKVASEIYVCDMCSMDDRYPCVLVSNYDPSICPDGKRVTNWTTLKSFLGN